MPTPTLFLVEPTGTVDQLRMTSTWSGGDLRAGYTSLVSLDLGGKTYLLAYSASEVAADAYEVGFDASPFKKIVSNLALGAGWDSLRPFVLGNRPYLMCYRRENGTFGFFELYGDLSVSKPYRWSHPRDPGLSVGFTVVQPAVCIGQVYYFGYNAVSGNVVLYSLSVTSTSGAEGVPPLAGHHLWQRSWAPAWTRFAFFRLGTGNYFLKTNIGPHPNVNIDQIRDNPADGTAEVATQMNAQLPDALTLAICQAFTLGYGDAYFAAYKTSGDTVLYRIHADCMGWTPVASGPAVPGASAIVPLASSGKTNLLFY